MPVLFAYSSRTAPLYLLCLGASRLLRSLLVTGSDPAGGQGSSGKWVPGPLHLPAAEATGKILTSPPARALVRRPGSNSGGSLLTILWREYIIESAFSAKGIERTNDPAAISEAGHSAASLVIADAALGPAEFRPELGLGNPRFTSDIRNSVHGYASKPSTT